MLPLLYLLYANGEAISKVIRGVTFVSSRTTGRQRADPGVIIAKATGRMAVR